MLSKQATDPAARRNAVASVMSHLQNKAVSQKSLALLRAACLPGEYAWPRVSSVYGSDPTATAKLYRKLNVRNPPVGTTGLLQASSSVAFAFRDSCLRAAVYSFGMTTTDRFAYNADYHYPFPASDMETFPRYIGGAGADLPNCTVTPHGDYLYPGRLGPSDQHRGWLLSAGQQLRYFGNGVGGLPVGARLEVQLKYLDGSQWVTFGNVDVNPAVAHNAIWTVARSGYYAVTVTPFYVSPFTGVLGSATGTVVIVHDVGFAPWCWAQLALPNIEDVLYQVRSSTITATSVMYTNTASPLNRQGQIVGLQLPKGSSFLSNFDIDELATDAKADICDVVNGRYGFLKPTQPADFDKRVFLYESTNSIIDAEWDFCFTVYPDSDYLVLHASVLDANGRQGYWTFDYTVEYTSLSQWADLRPPECTAHELEEAMQLLSSIPQWHTNALHLSDIWNAIKEAASDVWNGVKEVASVAGPIIPIAASLL